MPSAFSLRALLVFSLTPLLGAAAHARTWTNYQGKQIEAEYVRVDGLDVVLLMDGREFKVPLANLSQADKQFVFQQMAGGAVDSSDTGEPAEAPAAEDADASRDEEEDSEGATGGAASSRRGDSSRSDAARGIARIREWTDTAGNQIRAKFVRIHEGNVILMQGRRVVPCPIAKLSADDQQYLRELLDARGESHLMPSAEALAAAAGGGDGGEYAAESAGASPYTASTSPVPSYSGPSFSPPAPGYSPPAYSPPAMGESYADGSAGAGGYSPPSYASPAYAPEPSSPSASETASAYSSGYGPSTPDYGSSAAGDSGYAGGSYTPGGYPSYSGPQSSGDSLAADGYSSGSGMENQVAYNPPAMNPPVVPQFEWAYQCSECGKQVSKDDSTCPHCGAYFVNSTGKGAGSGSSSGSSGRNYRISGRGIAGLVKIAIFVVIGVGGVIARLLTGGRKE